MTETSQTSENDQTELWHKRFVHLNTRGILKLKNRGAVFGLEGVNINPQFSCNNCDLGKVGNSLSVGNDSIYSSKPLQLIHMDLWSPCRYASLVRTVYLLTITDDLSRYVACIP